MPIKPVSDADVDATLPHLPAVVADIVRFQRLTGCRPTEACIVRPIDVDRTGTVWLYRPHFHKTEHHGRERIVFVGPKAQEILRPYLLRPAETYCFVPAESERKRLAALHAKRKTPLSCGNRPGTNRRRKPKHQPGERYAKDALNRAIARACEAAGIDKWAPNRLRHSMATEVRRKFGLEAVQVLLGHSRADVSQIYAARDEGLGVRVAAEVG
ncbi:MAG: site-specific integrase [Planctomycetia bacterium]|nr:site-specific integrase [Planctomycetia bacterium]